MTDINRTKENDKALRRRADFDPMTDIQLR
jgi:hypothetical protein